MSAKLESDDGIIKLSAVAEYFAEHRDSTLRRCRRLGIDVYEIGSRKLRFRTAESGCDAQTPCRPDSEGKAMSAPAVFEQLLAELNAGLRNLRAAF